MALLFAVALPTTLALGCGPDQPPERIVLIVVDTLRRDHLSPYGSELATPNVKRLAETGQVFQKAPVIRKLLVDFGDHIHEPQPVICGQQP